MKRVMAFGEILLRLKPQNHERFFQSKDMECTFGGSEANVVAALSGFGQPGGFVTAVPDNAIGSAVISELRKYNVDTSSIIKTNGRLGIYFLETGAGQRPSNVIYDREESCIAQTDNSAYDWKHAFADAGWFHISGITPALSETAYKAVMASLKAAKEAGLTVSLDINLRRKLWKYGRTAEDVIKEMMPYVDILISNEEHIRLCLGISVPGYDTSIEGLPDEYFEKLSEKVKQAYPGLSAVTLTRRRTYTSDSNDFSASLYDAENTFSISRTYHIENIVDRIGGGDAFSAGLIYGLLHYGESKDALEFAAATACLKHTIPGDIALLSKKEVEQLVQSSDSSRFLR
jgi:2-dehydro-3-deoxygluconokinase